MKSQLLLIPMLLLGACRTTAETKEKSHVSNQVSTSPELLLRKRIGALPDTAAQIYDCTVMSTEVEDLAGLRKLIKDLPRDDGKIIKGYHFMATVPSIEMYAYEGTRQILIFKDHSAMEYPGDGSGHQKHPAATRLEEVLNKHCPRPKALSK